MSTSKKQVKSLRERRPLTLDMIDQANVDINFVASFIDLLSAASEAMQLETVESASITCMCFHTKIKIDALKIFIRSVTTCLDSPGKTAGNDMISEEIAAYGRDIEGEAYWIPQERMLFLTIPGPRAYAYS